MDVLNLTFHQMTQKEKESKINKIIEKKKRDPSNDRPSPTPSHPNKTNNQSDHLHRQTTTPSQAPREKTKTPPQPKPSLKTLPDIQALLKEKRNTNPRKYRLTLSDKFIFQTRNKFSPLNLTNLHDLQQY